MDFKTFERIMIVLMIGAYLLVASHGYGFIDWHNVIRVMEDILINIGL